MTDGSRVEKKTFETDCKQGAVRTVRFNVDGNYALTCGADKTIKLWNPHKGTLIKTYTGHGYEVLDAQSSCDSGQICSCGGDKYVNYWDVASGKMLRKYRGHAATVNCVSFNEESTIILSGSQDGTVRIWDCKSRQNDPIQIMDEAKDSVTSVKVSDHEILVASADGYIRRYDLRVGEMYSDCIGQAVTCSSFTRDGQCTLSSTLDSTVRLLDKHTGELLNEYKGHTNKEYKVSSCLNHNDTQVISGSEDGKVYIWDLLEASVVGTLDHGGKVVHSVSFHPTECCLLTACENKMTVWKDCHGQTVV